MSSTTNHQLPGLQAQAERVAEEFNCNSEAVQRVTRHFVLKLRDGLMKECAWQLPSFVRKVPTGNEKGSFLAVDLGGTNCRISLVDLHGDSKFTLSQRRHPVPPEVMVCKSYKPLFNFIAEKIDSFLTEKSPSKTYHLGFTFSFTCEQTSLASGTLIHWDKGWDIPEAVGKDPCIMLQEAIDQRGLPVLVTVLANDSVGTLLTRSYIAGGRSSTLASVIFGTGTNAAYVEKVSKIKRLRYMEESDDQIMLMNTEWGCLDDDMEVLPRTSYDDDLDRESPDPGSQMFEKRVSGMYLGEILRRILAQLVHQNAFEMTVDKQSPIFQQHSIDGSFLSLLATDEDKNCRGSLELVESKLLARNATISDVKAIKLLSAAIVRRAARLAGASLSAIIIQSGRLEATQMSTKYPDIEIAKYDVLTPAMAPSSGIKRFRHNLGVLWRRIILLLSSLTGIFQAHHRNNNYHIHRTAEHCVSAESIIDIGADGSLFELYPTFEADMREAMREVPEIGIDGEKRVRLGLAKDGSGMGAALMAQAALETGTTK